MIIHSRMLNLLKSNKELTPRLKVKLSTTRFLSGNKYVVKREVYFYKKPNPMWIVDNFKSDCSHCMDFEQISNLDKCGDGIYELKVTGWGRDYETGVIDEWEWGLVPWVDEVVDNPQTII